MLAATQRTSLTFRGALGHTYSFEAQATNLAGQTSAWASATSIVPTGVQPRGGRFSSGWLVHKVRGAWHGHAVASARTGATFTLRFVGGTLAVIGETTRQGAAAEITLDGRRRTIRLRSSQLAVRQVIYRALLGARVHHLRIRVLRGTVAIEGLAITSLRG